MNERAITRGLGSTGEERERQTQDRMTVVNWATGASRYVDKHRQPANDERRPEEIAGMVKKRVGSYCL